MDPTKEWYSQQEIGDMYGIARDQRYRISRVVQALRRAGVITTRRNPADEREVQVHRDNIETVRKALLADGDSVTA